MYRPEESVADLEEKRQAARWDLFSGFFVNDTQAAFPSLNREGKAEPEDSLYSDAASIAETWDKRNLTYKELDDEEERDRLALLKQIVHEIYDQFGCRWSNKVRAPGHRKTAAAFTMWILRRKK